MPLSKYIANSNPGLEKGFNNYKASVDADKGIYDYLMKATGGNGEHNK